MSERTLSRSASARFATRFAATLLPAALLASGTLTLAQAGGGMGDPQVQAFQQQMQVQMQGNQQFAGSVGGRVVCGDTQRPARFAQVTLVPVSSVNGGDFREGGRPATGRTDLDGVFQINNVAPGDYFLTASLPGYVSEGALIQAGVTAGADLNQLLGSLPTVRVSNGSTNGGITLQRGGTIAGAIQWDDGGPAAGVQVSAALADAGNSNTTTNGANAGFAAFNRNGNNAFGGAGGRAVGMLSNGGQGLNGITDDTGHFRLMGLAPGQYVIRAVVQAPPASGTSAFGFGSAMGSTLVTYAPGKPRRTEAQTIVIRGAEERNDIQVTLPLSGLHTVTGHVGAASGATIASGTVRLQDQADNSLQRVAQINSEGNFTVQWVPPGTYAMTVNGSTQVLNGRGGRSSGGPSFQPFQSSVTVTDGDLSGVNVNLSPASGSQ